MRYSIDYIPQGYALRCGVLFISCLSLLAVAVSSGCKAQPVCILRKPPVAYPARHFTGDWVGITHSDNDIYRMTLRADATGTLVALYIQERLVPYEIEHWYVASGGCVTCDFRHSSNPLEPRIMSCAVKENTLVATLEGVGGWHEEILFKRSKVLREQLSQLGI